MKTFDPVYMDSERTKMSLCADPVREQERKAKEFAEYMSELEKTGKIGKLPPRTSALPVDAQSRKEIPLCTGVYDYFPAALAEIAKVSRMGNEQHNPGQPLHHSRGKSTDHADTIARHLQERGTIDTDGQRHSAKMAWRALALLQQELEDAGAPLARGARL